MARVLDIAHARAGDKGDTSIIMCAPFRPEDIGALMQALAPETVAAHFNVPEASVAVREYPELQAVTVVVRGRLVGGVTRSPTVDPHGKTLSSHLLEMPLA